MTVLGELAEAATNILEERGWIQGTFIDRATGAVCLSRAMAMAYAQVRPAPGVYTEMMLEIRKLTGHGVLTFNDEIAQSKHDVLQLLRDIKEEARG